MNDFLAWVSASGERLTVTGVLMIAIFVLTYGQKKQWWVPGWTYLDLKEDYDDLKAKTDATTAAALEKLAQFERQQEEQWRKSRGRGSS